MKYNELTFGQMEAIVNKLGGMDGVKRFLSGELVVKAKEIVQQVVKVVVEYGIPLSDAIAFGEYDIVNENITEENFPSAQFGAAEVEIQLLHFGRFVAMDVVFSEMEKMGLRPATLPELLALGEDYPGLQEEFPIVALGSLWANPVGRYAPCLSGSAHSRTLDYELCERGWDKDWRFAAVRK